MKLIKTKSGLFVAASMVLLSGCMSVEKLNSSVNEKATKLKKESLPTTSAPVVSFKINSTPTGRSIDAIDERQAVNIKVSNANMYDLVTKLASRMGYGVSASSGIDTSKVISVNLNAANPAQAIRQMAWHAGYVAVINHQDKSVTIAKEATIVFRVPSDELKKLVSTQFKYGGSPVGGGASAASGGTSGAGFAPVAAEFNVTGNYTNAPTAFQAFIEELAGTNAKVQVYLEAGMVSVRSNGQALKRVHDFLNNYAFDARRQVEVNARVIEVSLADEFKYGIQWDKVMDAGNKKFGIKNLSFIGASNPAVGTMSFTGTSVNSIIEALETLTNVEVTSTPQITVSNNSSGVIFEGVQKPYMPSVTSTVTGAATGATTTLSGTGAYASDGIQMSIHANILDDENAVLTIIPSTVTLGNLQKFLNDNVQMFEQSVRNGGQRISIRSGETVVISGNRYTRGNSIDKGVPGLVQVPVLGAAAGGASKDSMSRQTVIIMNARILRPDPMDIVFSESI